MFRVTVCHQVLSWDISCAGTYTLHHVRHITEMSYVCMYCVCVKAFLLLPVFRSAHSPHIYVL